MLFFVFGISVFDKLFSLGIVNRDLSAIRKGCINAYYFNNILIVFVIFFIHILNIEIISNINTYI